MPLTWASVDHGCINYVVSNKFNFAVSIGDLLQGFTDARVYYIYSAMNVASIGLLSSFPSLSDKIFPNTSSITQESSTKRNILSKRWRQSLSR